MKGAEAEFVRGNYDKAREGYIRALLLDPNNYEAALFTGRCVLQAARVWKCG